MKILLLSYKFYPDVGGVETIGEIIAEQMVMMKHDVKVITMSEESMDPKNLTYRIVRRPSLSDLLNSCLWADIVFHNNISLQLGWLSFLFNKPQVIRHATWISRPSGQPSMIDKVKLNLLKKAYNIANSRATASSLPVFSVVIENPYQADLFKRWLGIPKVRDLIFVGRLVSDKGVDLLLRALFILKNQGFLPSLTIVGDGSEMSNLQGLAHELGIRSQLDFLGVKRGEELVKILNAHRIMVIPSRWNEPFGIVALEGIACGCVVIGSEGGGLKDAIGSCGLTFPNGDANALAEEIKLLLMQPEQISYYQSFASEHLEKHHPTHVTKAYLKVMEAAIRRDPPPTI
ncbi:MAG: glycosyltransferase family 4 protein [Cyanobacteriota bacterium]|nr:glycosyltransferase family 4 protein [Cyanobacteriota bacterium]